MMNDAYRAMVQVAADGGKVLFVGTKKQAQEVIQSEAERCGMWYVNQRWLGGTLTNFQTIRTRIKLHEGTPAEAGTGVLPRPAQEGSGQT